MEGEAVGHNFERDPPTSWFNFSRGEDLNVIFYQNMPNLQIPCHVAAVQLILTYTKAAMDN